MDRRRLVVAQAIPGGVGDDHDHEADEDCGTGRNPAFRHGRRKGEVGASIDVGRLDPKSTGEVVRIEPERGRVGAQESERVRVARKR